jgi:integrase
VYLKRKGNLWFAVHDVPPSLRQTIGHPRFVKSLETHDKKIAERRAAILKAKWLGEVEQARRQSPDAVERDAMFWRKVLGEATTDHDRGIIKDAIASEAGGRVDRAAAKLGIVDHRDHRYDELPETEEAERFAGIALGTLVRLDAHLDEYIATLPLGPNGKPTRGTDQKHSTIAKFATEFSYIPDITRKAVQQWINRKARDGAKHDTISRHLSELRGYWKYLRSLEVVSEDAAPFDKVTIPKTDSTEILPFEPAAVVRLHREALAKRDQPLADLIELGMWTGARIEELCALKLEDVHADWFRVRKSKTNAGERDVPIHSKLAPLVAQLRAAASNGFLLSNLDAPGNQGRKGRGNQYEQRSGAVGKRFGRLKTDAGFGENHVFHSIRHTVATLLENALVPENVSADIVGHEKPTMTYGLYSGGVSLEVKREAIEKLIYPFGAA